MEGEGKKNKLGHWVHLKHLEREGGFLGCRLFLTGVFSHKGQLTISPGSLGLNKSLLALPVMHKYTRDRQTVKGRAAVICQGVSGEEGSQGNSSRATCLLPFSSRQEPH